MNFNHLEREERRILREGLSIALEHIRGRRHVLSATDLTSSEAALLEGRYSSTLKELEAVYKKLKEN